MAKPVTSPTGRLLVGLAVTLVAVGVFSWYALRQIAGLRELQTRTVDRNRRDSLQLLRIQNDLYQLEFAMRDMLDNVEPYPLEAYRGQFNRIRRDLDDALRLEAQLAPALREPERQKYLAVSIAQFWTLADQMFELARQARTEDARGLIRGPMQAQQAAITNTVARLLVQNNEAEEQAAAQIQAIYQRVERNVYFLFLAVAVMIALTSLYLIYSNRRIFERLAVLSAQRRDLSRQLITVQEEVLHSISRELHDEFGQILTAIGALLRRVETRGLPPDSPLREQLHEVQEVVQGTLEKTRSLSQVLHPTVLDDGGLEKAVDWYLPVFEKQTGVKVGYEKRGSGPVLDDRVGIHVYRVLQEALNNVARHSRSPQAWVRLQFAPEHLNLEVEDRGVGLPAGHPQSTKRGIGMVAMRERAELLQGRIEFLRPTEGGTLVRLSVPLTEQDSNGN